MRSSLLADLPNNTKEKFTTLGQPAAQFSTSLSAEDEQQIATTVAALTGCLSTSSNS